MSRFELELKRAYRAWKPRPRVKRGVEEEKPAEEAKPEVKEKKQPKVEKEKPPEAKEEAEPPPSVEAKPEEISQGEEIWQKYLKRVQGRIVRHRGSTQLSIGKGWRICKSQSKNLELSTKAG